VVVTHIEFKSEFCLGSGEEYLVIEIARRRDRAVSNTFPHFEMSDYFCGHIISGSSKKGKVLSDNPLFRHFKSAA